MFVTRSYLLAWLQALALTQVVEAPIYRRALGASWPAALGASAITHPFVWFFFPWLRLRLELTYASTATLSEIFAWLVEAAWFLALAQARARVRSGEAAPPGAPYRAPARPPEQPPRAKLSPARAVIVSLLANGASVSVGMLTRYLFDWP